MASPHLSIHPSANINVPSVSSSSESSSTQSSNLSGSISSPTCSECTPTPNPHGESLTQRISTFKETFLPQLRQLLGDDKYTEFQEENARLNSSGIERDALTVGDLAPDFSLPSWDGHIFHLQEELMHKHVIIHFYRGSWCPYCNFALAAHSEYVDEYDDYNAQFIAITPVKQPTHELSPGVSYPFPILSDSHLEVIPAYRLLFAMGDQLRHIHLNARMLNIDLSAYYGSDAGELPIPATYVIEKQTGRIVWAHVDADFTHRADPLDIIEKLQEMRETERAANEMGDGGR